MAIGNPIQLTNNVASKVISVTATASQTLFTVEGGYRINAISVFRNGVRLADGTDFTAADGSTVTLLSAATSGDVLEFQIFDDFRVADAIQSAAATQTIDGDLTVTGTLTGASIGIQSAGTSVGTAKTLNFVGTGNTFAVNGDVIDVSIAGGGGGIGEVVQGTNNIFSYVAAAATITENITFDTNNAGNFNSYIISVIPQITIASGVGVTVGAGKTTIIDVLNLAGLTTSL